MDVKECMCLFLTGRYFLTLLKQLKTSMFPFCYGSLFPIQSSSTLKLYISHSFSTLPRMPSHCSQEFHSRASGLKLALDIDSLGHIQMCKNIKLNISIVGYIFLPLWICITHPVSHYWHLFIFTFHSATK